jgi:hypothetical protein
MAWDFLKAVPQMSENLTCPQRFPLLFRIDEQNVRVKITILKNMLLKYPEKFHRHFVVIARKRIRFIPLEGLSRMTGNSHVRF